MKQKETIYIAGPEVFFIDPIDGKKMLSSMRQTSEARGYDVSLPNDTPLDLNNKDIQKNANNIFKNLEEIIYDTTMIISDLDQFRGGEADGGTIYEIGMAYALGLKSYGYSRDIRPLVWKDQEINFIDDTICDEHENKHYYHFLPYSPLVMATTKLVQGGYEDALDAYEADKYYGHKFGLKHEQTKEYEKDTVFVANANYYDNDETKRVIQELDTGKYKIVEPYFREYNETEPISEWLDEILNENLKRLDRCEYFVGELSNYRGYEPSNDVSFLSGYAFQVGKKIYGYMDDARPMMERIPYEMKSGLPLDPAGREVENFNYPVNLMYSSSMKIVEGNLQTVLDQIVKEKDEVKNLAKQGE